MNNYTLKNLLADEISIIEANNIKKDYKFDGIQIPMIQRDYAQGRKSEELTRNRFLKDIFNSLKNNIPLEMDFVYGSIRKIDEKHYFIPLDGQQRLTTLFLLYWYVGNREKQSVGFLKGFSYETRASAKQFCEKISQISIDFTKEPSELLKNKIWFHKSYYQDPTIQGMLIMLDTIHEQYGLDNLSLWDHLSKLTFYILPLDGYDLTDELYIKMNARGKQLTPFENFKADLTKWLQDEKHPLKETCTTVKGTEMPFPLGFSTKMDGIWANCVWKNTIDSNDKAKSVDAAFTRFWKRYCYNEAVVSENTPLTVEAKNSFYDSEQKSYENFNIYQKILELPNANVIKRIEQCLDGLAQHYDDIKKHLSPSWNENDKWGLLNEEINQRQRIIFFAVTRYLELEAFDKTKFTNWIRVVWNIVIHPNLNSVDTMKLIDSISIGASNIYNYLHLTNVDKRLDTEKIKAILIKKTPEWESEIIEAEKHLLFKGNIKFLLGEGENTALDTFKNEREMAFQIFCGADGKSGNNYLWLRAALAATTELKLPLKLHPNNWWGLINEKLYMGVRVILQKSVELKDVTTACRSIIDAYTLKPNYLWLYQIVKWDNSDKTKCLLNYTLEFNVKNHEEGVYLFYKTNKNDRDMLLSNYRNQIVNQLHKKLNTVMLWHEDKGEYLPIGDDDEFVKRRTLWLLRQISDLRFEYYLDRTHIKVGIQKSSNPYDFLHKIVFADQDKDAVKDWICKKSFEYDNDIKKEAEIDGLIQTIETEIFDETNPKSWISIILKQKSLIG